MMSSQRHDNVEHDEGYHGDILFHLLN